MWKSNLFTKALLSAIPIPNPIAERKRKRIEYNGDEYNDYTIHKPSMREIEKNHFVYCREPEFEEYKKQLR